MAADARGRGRVDLAAMLPSLPFLFLAGCLLLEMGVVFVLCEGNFVYPLDDSYIPLALSEQLRAGHYGIDPGEPSAPASSILWPFLLAPTAGTSLHLYTPLVLCALGAFGTVVGMRRILVAARLSTGDDVVAAAFLCLFALTHNIVGLAMLGMEHSLHVMLTLWVVAGLIEIVESGRITRLLWAGLILGPLLRFEGFAVTLTATITLAWLGYRLIAFVGLAVPLAIGSAFAWRLSESGLGVLPSSVISRSASLAAAAGSDPTAAIAGALRHVANALAGEPQSVVLSLAASIFATSVVMNRSRRETPLMSFGVAVVGAHLLLGRYGYFGRYEVYVVTALSGLALYRWRAAFATQLDERPAVAWTLSVFMATSPVYLSYFRATLLAPLASRDIYRQQFQMYRFARDFFRGPVAVNDIGRVSYQNPSHVLDLWGLGNRVALESRRRSGSQRGGLWMDELARRHGTGVAMIYEAWLPRPQAWRRVAVLRSPSTYVVACRNVSFLLIDPSSAGRAFGALAALRQQLPAGVELEVIRDPSRESERVVPCR